MEDIFEPGGPPLGPFGVGAPVSARSEPIVVTPLITETTEQHLVPAHLLKPLTSIKL